MDRRLPGPLRRPLVGGFARVIKADVLEARLAPENYASLGAFFARELKPGQRELPSDPSQLGMPCDGRLDQHQIIDNDTLLQAKGQEYSAAELLGAAAGDLNLEAADCWTMYLAPSDYHRIHCPLDAQLEHAAWMDGARFSVAPKVLRRTPRVFVRNERVSLRLRSAHGTFFVVLVGALNVGRMRVVGLRPGCSVPERELHFARGAELGRFEMGSTVVLIWPKGGPEQAPIRDLQRIAPGQHAQLGAPLAQLDVTPLDGGR